MSDYVTNSVQQINRECTEIIDIANTLPYIDIGIMTRDLKDLLSDLLTFFDKHPGKTRDISMKKTLVEIKAIQLEHLIQHRVDVYRERHKMRVFSSILLKDVRDIAMDKVGKIKATGYVVKEEGDENIVALKWMDYFNFAVKFNNRSNHILFEVTPEDETLIKIITEEIKMVRGDKS